MCTSALRFAADADVLLNGRQETGQRDFNGVQSRTKPLADEDAIFVGEQLDGAATSVFRGQPYSRTHLGSAGRDQHDAGQFSEVVCCEARCARQDKRQ